MSVYTPVRLPDDLAAKIDVQVVECGLTRSQVIVNALRVAFGVASEPVGVSITVHPQRKQRSLKTANAIAAMVEAGVRELSADAPAPLTICPACSAPLVPWGPTLHRCTKCQRNW